MNVMPAKGAHNQAKQKHALLGLALIVFVALCALLFCVRAFASSTTLKVTNMTSSSDHASYGDTIHYSLSIPDFSTVQTVYVYFQSSDNATQQLELLDENNDGTYEGTLVIDEHWSEGTWQCDSVQAYTGNNTWLYARDKRAYPQTDNTNLSVFDVTIDKNSHAVKRESLTFEYANASYSEDNECMTIDVALFKPAASMYLYYNVIVPDSNGEYEELQVQLLSQGDSYHFTGTFTCENISNVSWQCKAVQSTNVAGQTTYLFDMRTKSDSEIDLSFLDAYVCEHQWSSWKTISPSTCYEYGVNQRSCSLCHKVEKHFQPLTSHVWKNVVIEKQATKTSTGLALRTCSNCGQAEKITIPVLSGYSCIEYGGGLYLVRYFPDTALSGSATFCGQQMYYLEKEQCWVILVKEKPEQLSASDFGSNASINTCVIPRPGSSSASSLAGDINNNGEVSVVDAQVVYDMVMLVYQDFDSIAMPFWLAADVNSDGFLDAADARAIQIAALSGWNIS